MPKPLHSPFGHQLMTIAEAVYATRLSEWQIRNWIRRGIIPRYGTPRKIVISWDDLAEALRIADPGAPLPPRQMTAHHGKATRRVAAWLLNAAVETGRPVRSEAGWVELAKKFAEASVAEELHRSKYTIRSQFCKFRMMGAMVGNGWRTRVHPGLLQQFIPAAASDSSSAPASPGSTGSPIPRT